MDAHDYNIIKDLTQETSTMSAIEVLYNFRTEKRSLIVTIRGIDLPYSNLDIFNHDNHTPKFPPQLEFMT